MARKYVPFEKVIQSLIVQGLIEKNEPHALTDAGHQYVRALTRGAYAHALGDNDNSYLKK